MGTNSRSPRLGKSEIKEIAKAVCKEMVHHQQLRSLGEEAQWEASYAEMFNRLAEMNKEELEFALESRLMEESAAAFALTVMRELWPWAGLKILEEMFATPGFVKSGAEFIRKMALDEDEAMEHIERVTGIAKQFSKMADIAKAEIKKKSP